MEHKLLFTNMTDEEFKRIIQETVSESIKELLFFFQKGETKEDDSEKLYNRDEVAAIYNVSYVTLRDWEKNKIIPRAIRKGTRVYWRKTDIIADINRREDRDVK